jgi:hypothetical protein
LSLVQEDDRSSREIVRIRSAQKMQPTMIVASIVVRTTCDPIMGGAERHPARPTNTMTPNNAS